jgi:hypothetical protein
MTVAAHRWRSKARGVAAHDLRRRGKRGDDSRPPHRRRVRRRSRRDPGCEPRLYPELDPCLECRAVRRLGSHRGTKAGPTLIASCGRSRANEGARGPPTCSLSIEAHGDFQFLTFEETPRFLRAAAPEWRAFVTIALKTGLRVGELLALRWEDLDLVAGRLMVRRTLWRDQEGTPKGGRTREVPLSDDAIAVLRAHRHLKGPYVFCEGDGARLTHSRVKEVVPWTCSKAGLAKRLTTHDLRHTFASLVMRGVALKAAQELLGHATIDMTMRYAHLSPDVKRDAVRLLDGPVTRPRESMQFPLTPTLSPADAGEREVTP